MSTVEYITSFEEIDRAIYEKLTGLVIDGEVVPVNIYQPDLDLEDANLPMIVVFRSYESQDTRRMISYNEIRDSAVILTDDDGNEYPDSFAIRDEPEPWNIYYTIRLYAAYHQDMNAMKWHFRKAFPKVAYVEIKGVKYDVFHVTFDLNWSGLREFGKMEEGKREMVEQYLIRLEASLDLSDRRTVKTAKELHINVQSSDPSNAFPNNPIIVKPKNP